MLYEERENFSIDSQIKSIIKDETAKMQIEKQKENDIYIKRELITAASVLLPACMMLFVESMARGSVKLTIDWIVANPMVAFINYAVWFIPFN